MPQGVRVQVPLSPLSVDQFRSLHAIILHMQKRKRNFSGLLIFVLLLVIVVLGYYFIVPDALKKELIVSLRILGKDFLPRLATAILNPLRSLGVSIGNFFGSINLP